jgi:cation-transporting P-type ATPase E
VFGRVTPHQKEAMVEALQARGHTVAMTGDGVNDVLALKLADLGIAMGSGAAATKAVAELVLLDGRFATLPGVVAEGRRVTANIERVANLFVTKTVWTALLAIAVSVALLPYPFLPRHLTIIDTLTIGVPSFFLALAPNQRRYLPGFASRVRTAAVLVAFILSLSVLVLFAIPLTWRRVLLVAAALAGFVLLFPLTAVRHFYALQIPRGELVIALLIAGAGAASLACFWAVSRRRGRRPRPVARP